METRHSRPILLLSLALALLTYAALSPAAAPIPAPPQVAGTGHLLVDFDSGAEIAEANGDQRLEPASLTKIMTAYVVFRELAAGKIALDDEVTVSEKAWRTPGSRTFIEVGTRVSVEDLLKGMIIQSGNDASVALAEHVAGSEDTFAELMNSHARRLGMADTHFTNSTGLPHEEHYTTPRDIAKVTAATIREFPQWYPWYEVKSFTYNDIKQHNRNKLLWRDDSVDGVKTGHTEAAGYCLVASAERDGMRLISVVMGTDGENARARETQALLNYGFRFFETHHPYEAGAELTRVRVWKGDLEEVPVGLDRTLHVTIPRGQYERLSAQMDLDPRVMAPVSRGRQVGRLRISLEGEPVAEADLIALADAPEGGLWAELRDTVLLWLE